MRGEPHSYPWCNLEGVKTATVGKEQGSAKHSTNKNTHSDLFLLLNPKGGEEFTICGAFSHNSVYISHAAVIQGKVGLISFQEESKENPSKQG